MNDNENKNINNNDIENSPPPEQDEDTEYMLQILSERKRERNASQTQTIERPVQSRTEAEIKPETEAESQKKPRLTPEQIHPKTRRFYNQYEDEKKHRSSADKLAKIPFVPIILGILIVAVTAALIFTLTKKDEVDDTEAPEETGEIAVERSDNEIYGVPDWITVNLLPPNKQSRPEIDLNAVNGAVVHYVGNPSTTAEQNRRYFAGLEEDSEIYASSNFIIGIDGEILLLVPTDEVAYCSNNRNYDTLSIECCHPDDSGEFTEATYQSLVKLLAWMCEEFDFNPEDIIRHYDITGKECPKDFVVNPEKWDQLLNDVASMIE